MGDRVIQDLPKEEVFIQGFGSQKLLSIMPFMRTCIVKFAQVAEAERILLLCLN